MAKSRYPDNWSEMAFKVKQSAQWKCAKCGMDCIKPNEDVSGLDRSERMRRTMNIHHSDYNPDNNREENLRPLCSGCHLSFHTGRRRNVPAGQLSLFENWEIS